MPQTPVLPALFTVNEVAAALRVEPSTIYRWAREGTVPSIRVAGTVRIPADAVEAFARSVAHDEEDAS